MKSQPVALTMFSRAQYLSSPWDRRWILSDEAEDPEVEDVAAGAVDVPARPVAEVCEAVEDAEPEPVDCKDVTELEDVAAELE